MEVSDDHVMHFDTKNRFYNVKRDLRNRGGKLQVEYVCECGDFHKNGFNGCLHTFAEQIIRKEVVVIGNISAARAKSANARRRAPRKRKAEDGRPIRAAQQTARENLEVTLPRFITSLQEVYARLHPAREIHSRGGQTTADAIRAAALLYKIAFGKSADAMQSVYGNLIETRQLPLKRAPHQNTLSDWINDPALTPVLRKFLRMTADPFKAREIGAIIDSSKFSQMSSAQGRGVDYRGDDGPGAEWMRAHAVVGVETMVVMAVDFGGTRGEGTHDVNFLQPLMSEARKTFALDYLLADKGYLSERHVRWLFDDCNIKAVIPAKKGMEPRTRTEHFEWYNDMIRWQRENQRDFHEIYRLRAKIEGFFSYLKRVTDGYCWSRGRPVNDANGNPVTRDFTPPVAWVNESLCKFIFMNLRITATLEEETGTRIDYAIPERFFRAPSEPLLTRAA